MKKLKVQLSRFWQDESAQGATEYILLLVVVVALALLFKDRIMSVVSGKVEDLGGQISDF